MMVPQKILNNVPMVGTAKQEGFEDKNVMYLDLLEAWFELSNSDKLRAMRACSANMIYLWNFLKDMSAQNYNNWFLVRL